MKTVHRSPTLLGCGLALALMASGAFAVSPPADPDPTAKGTPMQDTPSPAQSTQSTPYTSSSSSTAASDIGSNSKTTVSMQSKFDSLDINHDGYIDKQESAGDQKLAAQFDKLDANKDQKLSMTEFANAKGLAMTTKEKSEKDRQ
jgi:Ca2+-binding EF-hand superfamily protein